MSWVHGWHFSQSLLVMRRYNGRFITCHGETRVLRSHDAHFRDELIKKKNKNWNCLLNGQSPTCSGRCLGVPREGSRVFRVLGLWALPMFGFFSRLDVCRSVGPPPCLSHLGAFGHEHLVYKITEFRANTHTHQGHLSTLHMTRSVHNQSENVPTQV